MRSLILVAVGALALSVAVDAGADVSPAPDKSSLDGTAWVLEELQGHVPRDGLTATLQFAQGRVSGSDGCNRYTGAYTATGAALEVSQLASTQMACAPAAMQLAQAFTAALTGATSYRVVGRRLELLAASGNPIAVLGAQSLVLVGTSWEATGINNGRQAVVSLAKDTRVTLSFGADGAASGSAGCNNYSAPYKAEGTTVTFGQAALTRKTCGRPEGVMEQERQFLEALSTVTTSRFEGDRLELRTAEGALAVSLVRAAGG